MTAGYVPGYSGIKKAKLQENIIMYVSQNDIAYKAEIRRDFERDAEQYRQWQNRKETVSAQDEIESVSLTTRIITFVRSTVKMPARQTSSLSVSQKPVSVNE